LTAATGATVYVIPPPHGTVTVSMRDRSLPEALRMLFGADVSYVFVLSATENLPEELWILRGSSAPASSTLTRPADDGMTRTSEEWIAEIRASAGQGNLGLPTLLKALRDESPPIRLAAIEAIGDVGDDGDEANLAIDALAAVLAADPSPGCGVYTRRDVACAPRDRRRAAAHVRSSRRRSVHVHELDPAVEAARGPGFLPQITRWEDHDQARRLCGQGPVPELLGDVVPAVP